MSSDTSIEPVISRPDSLPERYKIASKSGLSRNDLCCCGSGNKLKKCCLSSEAHAGFMAHKKELQRINVEQSFKNSSSISLAALMAMVAMGGRNR